jgi:acyl-CoA synthetase (AMP-forming)/AMP-acid ligase II
VNLANLLANVGRSYADRAASIDHLGTTRTWAQALRRSDAAALWMTETGVAPGDRVSLYMRNHPDFIELMFAAWKVGAVLVPMNSTFTPDEAEWHLDHVGATVVFTDEQCAPSLSEAARRGRTVVVRNVDGGDSEFERIIADRIDRKPIATVEREDDDVAWIAFTSGTTGRPKGAMLTHGNLHAQAMSTLSDVMRLETEHVVVHAAPLSHGTGYNAIAYVAKGCTQVFHQTLGFKAGLFLEQVERYRIAGAFLVPTQINMLVDHEDAATRDLSSLEWIMYGGAPMYRRDQKRALAAFGNVFVQIFGQTESPMSGTVLRREEHSEVDDERSGSVGRVRLGLDIRILDESGAICEQGHPGEICLNGRTVMLGYWDNPEATAKTVVDGWLHTGDIGVLDERGYLHIQDRIKDMIISGGLNVYPAEVENALLTHPEVDEACVIGVPDEKWGEAVRAVVVRIAGSELDGEDLIAYAAQHLAGYKKPKRVEFVESLPKTSYGKLDKKAVRAQYWAGVDRVI